MRAESVKKNEIPPATHTFSEAVKWAATLVLWLKFAVTLQLAKGNKLVLFRWNVTKGLLAIGI